MVADNQEIFNNGVKLGISIMQSKLLYACEHNKPVEINDKVYWIENDIQHLRKIMDSKEI